MLSNFIPNYDATVIEKIKEKNQKIKLNEQSIRKMKREKDELRAKINRL